METLNKHVLVLVILATMAASSSLAGAQAPLGLVIHVNGTLYCSSNGGSSGPSTPVFPNATVQVACAEDVIYDLTSNATTNSNGVYLVIVLRRSNATVSSIVSNCKIFVRTPLSTCNPSLPSTGLVSNLHFVKTVQNGFIFATYMAASGFASQV